jgi:hypothetical protein
MDEVFHVLGKNKKPLKMWRFEGICMKLSMFGNMGPGFQKNHWQYGSCFSKKKSQVVKNKSSKIFARVPLENGVWCGAFDAQSRCIPWHVYLIFQLFNTGNEFVDQRQMKTPPKQLLVSHVLNVPVRKREEEEEQNIINSLKSSKKSEL